MNNADMPAMPLNQDARVEYGIGGLNMPDGLTKREYFASLDMSSAAAPCRLDDHHGRAAWAIAEADALLAELDKENQ